MVNTEKVRTNVYLGKNSKEKAQQVLKKYGLNLSEALNLFLAIIAETGSLPFEFRVPNQTTRKVISEVLAGDNLVESSVEEILHAAKEAQAFPERSTQKQNDR
ncbi:type II toxin-antitoxin system RelB/DinJ family antitoxin [Thermodesulfatator indicus]